MAVFIRYETEIEHPVSLHRRKKPIEEYTLSPADWTAETDGKPADGTGAKAFYHEVYGQPLTEDGGANWYAATFAQPFPWDHTQTMYTSVFINTDCRPDTDEGKEG